MITFSIVINTLNRAALLQETLESLCRLRYAGRFEVIVVNGPSTDDSEQVIASWLPRIRTARCDVGNLSVSRNIGICMAAGDVVAFIDDDAIPEPEWLTELAAAYQEPGVGGAGGRVLDSSGYTFQYHYATANRLGDVDISHRKGTPQLCFPGSREFPYLQGTNASFLRSALLEVRGFDEEFEYFLDETDVCCRLVDAGYLLKQLPHAYVHHKTAPNEVRDHARLPRAIYPILKNTIYFSLKHGLAYATRAQIDAHNGEAAASQRRHLEFMIANGSAGEERRARFEDEHARAWNIGTLHGLKPVAGGIDAAKRARWQGAFLPFATVGNAQARTLVLVSRDYPPNHRGGIATFSRDLAEALAAEGHQVYVITESATHSHVELVGGVWVHRIALREYARTCEAMERSIPQEIWNWSATALAAARRIASQRPLDLVEAPIWDAEGAAFLLAAEWPLVTSLHTTLHFSLQGRTELRDDAAWMARFGTPMLALEKELMQRSQAIRANSAAIRRDIEQAYGFRFDDATLRLVPLGMPDVPHAVAPATRADGSITVLFVGRLEARKGIDVLLAAVDPVLAQHPRVRFRIIGDDTLLMSGAAISYKEHCRRNGQLAAWGERVTFEGRVDDATLRAAYRDCDVFVAPSRYESFGLVFVEAMREARPVIGCAAGGMPEVVSDGVNGILVAPDDSAALAGAIGTLAASPELRAVMGRAGRALFEDKFISSRMAQDSAPLYGIALGRFAQARQ
ncbi:glycosyltransferase [Massilia sp. CCM 9210]|uniref:glycosyltransferase n=1 Tax=Massilia scottii TaxID=3057166 RepID=UPI002796D1D2|nr:glycosyltransferase [Massilia sp. CCM 9210]MDQ1817153.1 glycosyltransferase [Massilia sp. CCM 9210]